MIKFKNNISKNNNIEYIKYGNIILPIKSILYIEKINKRRYDTVINDIYYTIYFGETLRYECNNPFGNHAKEYKLNNKSISIEEEEFNKVLKPILNDKIINIKQKCR